MVKARARTTAKKVKDKWKSKQWYSVLAPNAFNKAVIAESLADDPQKLIGRIATTTMQDLTGDFKLMHVKLDFQVERVNGNQAEARFIGHSLTSDYVRRLVRRNHSKVSLIVDATTKDGALIRVKPIAVTEHRAQSSQSTVLRSIITRVVLESAAEKSLGEFAKEMLDGRLAQKIQKASKPIYPLRKIELNKSEVRQAPTITLEDLEQPPAAPETPPPTEGGGAEGAEAAPSEPAPEGVEAESEETVEVAATKAE
jgi:small subunit ribosomal protein S3Ae